jgi:hypothetical protein
VISQPKLSFCTFVGILTSCSRTQRGIAFENESAGPAYRLRGIPGA